MFDFLNQKKGRTPPELPAGTVRRRYSIHGQVQGVGFRYRAMYAARELGLTGWVQNEDDGSVTLEVQGDPALFLKLFAMIQRSDYIQIAGMRQQDLAPDPWERGFNVMGY
ncbi:MAG: acylphosphatase [Faecalibacterium sp.]